MLPTPWAPMGTRFVVRREQGSVWLCRTTIPIDDDAMLAQVETYVVETMLVLVRHWLGDAWQPLELWLQGKPRPNDDRFAEIPQVRYRASLLAFPVALHDGHAPEPAPSRDPSSSSDPSEDPLDATGARPPTTTATEIRREFGTCAGL